MPYADNDGVELAYEQAGDPEGETVVFVEGLGYGRWMWNWQRDALEEDYSLVLWDNRGSGDSEEPEGPYTTEQMAADLEAVLEAVGAQRAHVVGASMGGMIAQQYALDYDRAESVTLLCTAHGGEEAIDIPEETLDRMFNVPEGYDERETIRYKMKPAVTEAFWEDNQELIDQIVDWRLESDASDRAREFQGAAVEAFDVSDRLGDLSVPALVMHGTEDRVVPTENGRLVAEKIPNAEFELVDDAGHLFFIERDDVVSDRIRTFLAEQ